MYRSVSQIADLLGMSRVTVRKYKKLISEHPERYGLYGVAGNRISLVAVVDAMKWRDAIEAGLIDDLPPFDAEAAAKYLTDLAAEA